MLRLILLCFIIQYSFAADFPPGPQSDPGNEAINTKEALAALTLLTEGNIKEAIEKYLELLKDDRFTKKQKVVIIDSALMNFAPTKHPKSSIKLLNILIQSRSKPEFHDHMMRCWTLAELKEFEKAHNDLNILENLGMKNADLEASRAALFEKEGKVGKAKEHLLIAYKAGNRSRKIRESIRRLGLVEKIKDIHYELKRTTHNKLKKNEYIGYVYNTPETGQYTGDIIKHLLEFTNYIGQKHTLAKLTTSDETGVTRVTISKKNGANIVFNINGQLSHPWDHRLYTDVIAALIDKDASPGRVPGLETNSLLNANLDVLIKFDKKCSSELNKKPTNPNVHTKAALLHCIMSLIDSRESYFADNRQSLHKACMHLSMASHLFSKLKTPESFDFKLADILIDTLTGRQLYALKKLDSLESLDASSQWHVLIELLNSNDYRSAQMNPDPSPLVAALTFCVMREHRLYTMSDEYAKEHGIVSNYTWRHIMNTQSLSVGMSHTWSSNAIEMQIATTLQVMSSFEIEIGDLNHLCKVYNGGNHIGFKSDSYQIIGPVTWANILKRGFCQSSFVQFDFRYRMLGWGGWEEFLEKWQGTFGTIDLAPYTLILMNPSIKRCKPMVKIFYKEYTANWPYKPVGIYCRITEIFKNHRLSIWKFTKTVPWGSSLSFIPGTTYQLSQRLKFGSNLEEKEINLYKLAYIAPNNLTVRLHTLDTVYKGMRTSDLAMDACREFMQYSVRANQRVLAQCDKKNDRKVYEEVLASTALLDPSFYPRLGKYYAETGDFEKAAQAYEDYIKLSKDSVSISHYIDWLYFYYQNAGDQANARRIAETAYVSRAHNGYKLMGVYHELNGDLEKAEEIYTDCYKHYDNAILLCQFYIRTNNEKITTDRRCAEHMEKTFPDGLQQLDLREFKTRPETGALTTGNSFKTIEYNIPKGSIIVGVDGYKISNIWQCEFIQGIKFNEKMTYSFWDKINNKYRTIEGVFPCRKLNAGVKNYSTGKHGLRRLTP